MSKVIHLVILINFVVSISYAERTNINEITKLFDKNIDNKEIFFRDMKDQNKETAKNIESGDVQHMIEGASDGEVKINELNSLDPFELNESGRRKRASNEFKFYDEYQFEPDYTKAGNSMHKKDVDEIVAGTANFNDLIERLKEYEIEFDCKSVKGSIEKSPTYHIDIKKDDVTNTVYDQFFCEELRNEYNCRDELTVHCSDPSYVTGSLSNITGNMVHNITQNSILTIGVNKEKYFYNSWGSQNDYYFTFNVNNVAGIETFKLLSVSWSDHVFIELNGNMIFGSNGVVRNLNMSTSRFHYRRGPDGEKYYGVDRGDGQYVSANTKSYFDNNPNFEAKHFLKEGNNTLHIRLVYGKGGKIFVTLQYLEKICPSWQETWTERCNIK